MSQRNPAPPSGYEYPAWLLELEAAHSRAPTVMASTEPTVSKRASAIATGLARTNRARKVAQFDQGMVRLKCLSGGDFYWISLDGRRLLRGAAVWEADELQANFADAMARAGRRPH